jgi:hypothetical protein
MTLQVAPDPDPVPASTPQAGASPVPAAPPLDEPPHPLTAIAGPSNPNRTELRIDCASRCRTSFVGLLALARSAVNRVPFEAVARLEKPDGAGA